mmetsp:Transcript_18826/g.55968  ORF Transcript_18826/g.55968 Transcript_18826/m.55968 type:complete len:189 (-) Transcript_18826:28-594(-)
MAPSAPLLLAFLATSHSLLCGTSRRRLRPTALRNNLDDAIDELLPRFRTKDDKAEAKVEEDAPATAQMSTVNAKLLADIEAAKAGVRVEAVQVDEREDVDISDVNPVQSVLSGFAALAAAYVCWLGVQFAAEAFAANPITSDFYPVQRISGAMRTVVLGLGTLLTGITAFAGMGMLALGAKVAVDPDE